MPFPDEDQEVLCSALAAAGAEPRVLGWDDPEAPFERCDAVVIRSTWNYLERRDEFVAWARDVERHTRLWNPAAVIAANSEKTYLRELEAKGIGVVPTEFVARGAPVDLARVLERRRFGAVVIKPTISAGSWRTEKFEASEQDQAARFLRDLVAERGAMIQAWMPSVDDYGERSVVCVDGRVSHAVRKSARFGDQPEALSGEMPIADDERAFARRVLHAAGAEGLLYARVDMVRDGDELRLMELELIEPSLYWSRVPAALDGFVQAILRRAA